MPFRPYTPDSFFKSRADRLPTDDARTQRFRDFMRTFPDQVKSGDWPKVNVSPDWAMSYHLERKVGAASPVWRLVGGNTSVPQLRVLASQGFHMPDEVADTFPVSTADRPGLMIDRRFGYTAQFADAVPDKAARTIEVSNAEIMWHDSNGIDGRSKAVRGDPRNYTSRGRIIDAMVVRRDLLDWAVANGTGLGHVLHLFHVETEDAFCHPMIAAEGQSGFGAEGERIRIDPSVDLAARGLTGAALALARTLQQHGCYLGDNSGSGSQIKASQKSAYAGTNLDTDCLRGKVRWDDFEVVERGAQ